MDWFLYDIGLRHERVNENHEEVQKLSSEGKKILK